MSKDKKVDAASQNVGVSGNEKSVPNQLNEQIGNFTIVKPVSIEPMPKPSWDVTKSNSPSPVKDKTPPLPIKNDD